jgi:hypothetical protein
LGAVNVRFVRISIEFHYSDPYTRSVEFLILLILKCAVVFVLGAALFDTVHYILHVWEDSRVPLLRWAGGLHGVHHKFLDRQMKIQREHTFGNLFLHVLPEYGTAVVGMALMGFVFGWLPVLIVIGIRTVMVAVYFFQKGEDFTHYERTRVNGKRYLLWVGPHYHALHHIYVKQYYSSFMNLFDLFWGTNCQTEGRTFYIHGSQSPLGDALKNELLRRDGLIASSLSAAEVLLIADADITAMPAVNEIREAGKNRLLPPEVWVFARPDSEFNSARETLLNDNDITYRHVALQSSNPPLKSARSALFWIKRGFRSVRA